MKKLIAIAILCLPLATFAQIEKGKPFLSGGILFSSTSPDDPQPGNTKRYTRFNVDAMAGILVAETWAVGLNPSRQSQAQTFYDDSKNRTNLFSIGPFVRKYFACGEKFYFHLDLSYAYVGQRDYTESPTGDKGPITKSTTNVFALRPGASYFITDRVALQAMLGNLSYSLFKNQGNEASTFEVNFSISSFSLGAAVYFK